MENAKNKFVTDLTDRSENTIILQPGITTGMRRFDDIFRIHNHFASPHSYDRDRCVWEVIRSIMDSRWFVHTGTLKTNTDHLEGGNMVPESYDYQYCGNFFEATVNDQGELTWYCEYCKTKMRFYHIKAVNVPDLLLHLLIKQMVPSLRTGNYIWTEETGVVSVLHDGLAYKPINHTSPILSWRANLGFVLVPGMQTLKDQGGFGEWLRYLVQVKFDQLQELADSQLPHLIGPKHMGQLNSGLRFWR